MYQAKTVSEGFVAIKLFPTLRSSASLVWSELVFMPSDLRRNRSSLIVRRDSSDFRMLPIERKYSDRTVSHLIAISNSWDVESLMRDAMIRSKIHSILSNAWDSPPSKAVLIYGNNRTWQCVYVFTFVLGLACKRLPSHHSQRARVQLLPMMRRPIDILQMQIRKVGWELTHTSFEVD